jgi:hypothetical protein
MFDVTGCGLRVSGFGFRVAKVTNYELRVSVFKGLRFESWCAQRRKERRVGGLRVTSLLLRVTGFGLRVISRDQSS